MHFLRVQEKVGGGKSADRTHSAAFWGGMEPGSFETCIQYNVFDQSEGTQERKMECEIADRTLIEVIWQLWTNICQNCHTLCKMGAGSESVKSVQLSEKMTQRVFKGTSEGTRRDQRRPRVRQGGAR